MTDKFGLFGEPQKAKHLHLEEALKSPNHLGKDYCVMQKFDGWFMYIDCVNGVWQGIRSKTGRLLPSMAAYSRAFEKAELSDLSFRLIFEAYIPGVVFKDQNGLYNQKKTELNNVDLMCHDILFLSYPHSTFTKRYSRLTTACARLSTVVPAVQLVPILATSQSKEEWLNYYEDVLKLPQGEGIILKEAHAEYTQKARNAGILKIKCELTLDVLVVGLAEGKKGSKYTGTLGTLIVREASGKEHPVSGMTDEQRTLWWDTPEIIMDAVVEIQAMKRLPNGSLREARFKAERHDKSVEDID